MGSFKSWTFDGLSLLRTHQFRSVSFDRQFDISKEWIILDGDCWPFVIRDNVLSDRINIQKLQDYADVAMVVRVWNQGESVS